MAIQFSVTVGNARLDAIETAINTAVSPGSNNNNVTLCIFSGSAPANSAASSTGTLLAEIALSTNGSPVNWMADAASRSKSKNGTWTDASANNTGTAGYFRIFNQPVGATYSSLGCEMQGTVGTSAADMIVNSTSFVAGNSFTINTFTLTDGNA